MKVLKRDGTQQEFERVNIAWSVIKAGACEELGWKIANGIKPYERMPSTEIARQVLKGLLEAAKEMGAAYGRYHGGKMDRASLEKELLAAGACDVLARKIARELNLEGMSDEEAFRAVESEVQRYISQIATAYKEYKKEEKQKLAAAA